MAESSLIDTALSISALWGWIEWLIAAGAALALLVYPMKWLWLGFAYFLDRYDVWRIELEYEARRAEQERLNLLSESPPCAHHSRAIRGGQDAQ